MSVNNPCCTDGTMNFKGEWMKIILLCVSSRGSILNQFSGRSFHLFLCNLMSVVLFYDLLNLNVHRNLFLETIL